MFETDPDTGQPLVDVILDEAQQKGTGKWMSQNAFDVGAPIPTVNAAVEARLISALKTERVAASRVLAGHRGSFTGHRQQLIEPTRQALYACKITSYAQGMALLRMASAEYHYDIQPGEVARIWRAGCIIRAALLGDIREAYRRQPALVNLMLDAAFRDALGERQEAWRARAADGNRARHPDARDELVAGLLRRLPSRAAAREPDPGAARLLRRAHLPPRRSRRRLSHEMG